MAGRDLEIRVCCCDGWAGTLLQYQVDPKTGVATHVLVEPGPVPGHQIRVPAERVIASGCEVIFLDISIAQLKASTLSEVADDHGGCRTNASVVGVYDLVGTVPGFAQAHLPGDEIHGSPVVVVGGLPEAWEGEVRSLER